MLNLDRFFLSAIAIIGLTSAPLVAQQPVTPTGVFRLGETVTVVASPDAAGLGSGEVSASEMRTFDKSSLEQAVNLVPGVSSTLDANARRNESDIFVRGFGRWQVPLMVDGVRVYLPADNRIDFARFVTADVAAIQIRKGYASVLDGPGAMGGSINLVTRTPTRPFEVDAGASIGGREGAESWSGHVVAGARRPSYYVQGSVNHVSRDFWSLSGGYQPTAVSLQQQGRRVGSDSRDSRVNAKVGYTPNATDEYTINYTRQAGEKGAPLNVYNNPPVPLNSFWRWPRWDLQNTSFLSHTQVKQSGYVKTKVYFNTLTNALDAYDDITYTTQDTTRAFHSPYDDHASGVSVEVGGQTSPSNVLKAAVHYRADAHREQQTNRVTHPTLSTTEPAQDQAQRSWAVAIEDTRHLTASLDVVGGLSYERYAVTKAQEFNPTLGLFEYPKGGADSVNWQGAVVSRHAGPGDFHFSVSSRTRFPVFLELYSTRLGTATPNPDLGPERATNIELGWRKELTAGHVSAAVFYSDVRSLVQAVVLPDGTNQSQNVGDGHFEGAELDVDLAVGRTWRVGANYGFIRRVIADALLPNLRATGVPTHKGFLSASWQPLAQVTVTPSLELAGDRWSDINPAPAFPYVRTGAYRLVNVDATWDVSARLALTAGLKNASDDYYELAWGLPQPGRTFYVKTRVQF